MKKETEQIRKTATETFLTSLAIRRQLAQVEDDDIVIASTPEEDARARAECARSCRPFDKILATGQVRVLSQTAQLTYALVAQRWDARSWLVIPFSSYSSPATDREIRALEEGGVGLRVLQLWNARSLSDELLSQSWIAGSLPAAALSDAVEAWRANLGAVDFTDEQRMRTGLPIQREDDPRWTYLEDASQNFAKLDAEEQRLSEKAAEEFARLQDAVKGLLAHVRPFAQVCSSASASALAAAPCASPISASSTVEGVPGTIYVRYLPAEKKLHLRAFDAAGERSTALSGWQVFDAQGDVLGVFEASDCTAVVDETFDGVLAVVEPNGTVHPLLKGENE